MPTPPDSPPLILASSSPRRRALLKQISVTPDKILSPDIDETPQAGEQPRLYAERMARAKAAAIAETEGSAIILAADTTVACGRRILAPAEDEKDARRCLALISGRRHKVHSAIAVIDPSGSCRSRLSTSTVAFKRLSPEEVDGYIHSGEWRGKAGGYAIQGRAGAFIRSLSGSYSGVVGLPLFETRQLLIAAGYRGL